MDSFFLMLFLALIMILISRQILHRARKKLDAPFRTALDDLYSGSSRYALFFVIIAFAAFYFLMRYNVMDRMILQYVYYLFMALILIASQIYYFRKLRKIGVPDFYIRAYIYFAALSFVAITILMTSLAYSA